MLPIKITPEMQASLDEAQVITFNAPEGGEHDVDSIQGLIEIGVPYRFGPDRIYVPFTPSEDDIARLSAGQPLWVAFVSHRMPVFQVYVQPLPASSDILLSGGAYDGRRVSRDQVAGWERIEVEGEIYTRERGAYIHVESSGTHMEPEVG